MNDRETEAVSPYEPEPQYDWDYGEEPRKRPNVMWGRLVLLAVLALLAFFVGRASAPGGVPAETVRNLRAQVERSEAEIEQLKAALAQPSPVITESPPVNVEDQGDEGAEDTEFTGKTYVVQGGDTLRDIAEQFCDDATEDDYIAEFNDIEDPSLISAGTELLIPEDCGE